MIEFTRLVAKQARAVFRKALGNSLADLRLLAGPGGLRIQGQSFEHAVEFHDPAPRAEALLMVPLAVLDDVQGSRSDPVALSSPKKTVLAATWKDRGVARTVQYHRPKDHEEAFPAAPSSFREHPPGLVAALRDAYETTDSNGSRYALGCIQLRGKSGQIAATDGRHLLLQSGYAFGFDDDLLVQNTRLFSAKELPHDQPVLVGKTDTHLTVRIGRWTFYLGLNKDGRFPRIEQLIPDYQRAQTTLELHLADAEFFLKNVDQLPGSIDEVGVTCELEARIALRAKTCDTPAPVEIALTNSRKTGENVTVCLNRRNLVRTAQMGFARLYLFGQEHGVLARDDSRSYFFMPLIEQDPVCASPDCLRIESPLVARPADAQVPSVSPTPLPMTTRNTKPVEALAQAANIAPASGPESETNAPSLRRRRASRSSGSAIDQAVLVREQLRTTLSGIKDLIRALKAEKRNQKSLKLALDSLKQLQAAA